MRRGCRLLRVAGSYHIYGKPDSVVRLSIPIHGNRPLKTELLRHLAKLGEVEDELTRSVLTLAAPQALLSWPSSGYPRI